jgi:tRNA-Thr(GGU) m(6)t(6)A37 methyltransferase TsaA
LTLGSARQEDWLTDQYYEVKPIGRVESHLVDRAAAPKQGDEGAPEAWLNIDGRFGEGLRGLQVGADILVLTWLHQARRDAVAVHPRGDRARPRQGVFSTRSEDRPNPIGLHRVTVVDIDGTRIRVRPLEAIDGTPVVDVKPILEQIGER